MNRIHLLFAILFFTTFSCKKLERVNLSDGNKLSDVDGNIYKIVNIGTQLWMAENLRTSRFNDNVLINDTNITKAKWYFPRNSDSLGKIYGKLYNWNSVSPLLNGNRNVCPNGWHVPTKSDWELLSTLLGGDSVAGSKLKESGTKHWDSNNLNSTNSTGFTALPGIILYSIHPYTKDTLAISDLNFLGSWWCSTETNSFFVYNRKLESSSSFFNEQKVSKKNFSFIRCLKD